MPRKELTDKFCPSAKTADYFDTIVRGLCFRVTAGGSRAWFFIYGPAAKRTWLKLGAYPELGLAAARQKARDARGAVGEGKDPIAEKRARAAGETVRDLVENYIARHAAA